MSIINFLSQSTPFSEKPKKMRLVDISPDMIRIMSDKLKEDGEPTPIHEIESEDLCLFRLRDYGHSELITALKESLPYVLVYRQKSMAWGHRRWSRTTLHGFERKLIIKLFKLCGITAPSREYEYFNSAIDGRS